LAGKSLTSVLIKPAGPDCNLQCGYCFYLGKGALFGAGPHRMNQETLERVVRQTLGAGAPVVTFCWQGGEPTLMGLDFFCATVSLQRKHARSGQRVENALQTNGWLVDDAWCDFFRQHQFLLGLSLDGPAHVHDRYRRTLSGGPTHARVAKTAERLLRAGVAVNALVVVNDYSVHHGREIYNFLRDMGFRFMQFIPFLPPPGRVGAGPEPSAPPSMAYGDFLIEVFECWQADFRDGWPTVTVRHLEALFATYVNGPPLECTLAETCGDYVVVEHNGDVYACDFFVQPDWFLGNVHRNTLGEMLNCERQRTFGERKAHLTDNCRQCRWLQHCRGGCPAYRGSDAARAWGLCAGYQRFLEHADGFMRALARQWREREYAFAALQSDAMGSSGNGGGTPPLRGFNGGQTQRGSWSHVGRNAPCPCGSGRKFKHCCGQGR